MKKITALLVLVVGFTLYSCSDDDQNSGGGDLKISGQVMSPNNDFPISRAVVKVFEGQELIAQKTTDALGNFTVEDLPEGQYTVVLSKGKFTRTLAVDLQQDYTLDVAQRNFDTFPKIGVMLGTYDQIEEILFGIGVVDDTGAPAFDIIDGSSARGMADDRGHQVAARNLNLEPNVAFSIAELLHSPEMLAEYDILFFNCNSQQTLAQDAEAMNNLKTFVENGGIIYATDWMYKYIQSMFPQGYLNFAAHHGGNGGSVVATLGSTDLENWLEAQGISVTPTVTVDGFLGGWQMVDSFNDDLVDGWVIAPEVYYSGGNVYDKPLAYTFGYGCGGVFYSSFHTHGNYSASAAIDQMMAYFVFELSGLGLGCPQS